ncbi:hypothetical protein BDV95DRAFT_632305 [Massariosphaeria phaeospora]|uniref:Uncharacterized protein n=1 Tax=Massariosphaeria phaeospora TaxID=100035 RepID=A0A7C8I2T9_9PLEO|nr:hypothetical protein BDV95DRAFT_632305 [Massariosphaeria phaeospora]
MELKKPPSYSSTPGTQRPSQPLQQYHPTQCATTCTHEIHRSAPAHTPYCPACITKSAKTNLEFAQGKLLLTGGLDNPPRLRDADWKRANLVYQTALRALEKVRKKDQLRWERENAWDAAHASSEASGGQITPYCNVCTSVSTEPLNTSLDRVQDDVAWWEKPGGLASYLGSPTPPRSRPPRPKSGTVPAGRGSSMGYIVRELRAALAASESEQREWYRRYETECAVRRKYDLGENSSFEPTFWDSPISSAKVRELFHEAQEIKLKNERFARGNKLRPRPPRSSLSRCETAEEFEIDEEFKEKMRLEEEAEEAERMEREAQKVGEEVGYLYWVGCMNLVEEWKEDFLRSNHNLVWRDRMQPPEEMALSEEDTIMEEA